MQTMEYAAIPRLSRRTNVIDLDAYRRQVGQPHSRRRQAARRSPSLGETYRTEGEGWSAPRPTQAAQSAWTDHRRALALEVCASLGIVVMTLTFALRLFAL